MRMHRLVMLSAIIACSAVAASAGDMHKHMDKAKAMSSDSWVTAKTKIALFADKRVKGREVNVETKAGKVMIRGKVDTDEAKAAAEEIAEGIEGASSVKNELQVVPRKEREAVDDKDEAINDRVERSLKALKKQADISVKTNDGVVSLTGSADDLTTSAKASWKAWKVDGVKSVKNDLTIKGKS